MILIFAVIGLKLVQPRHDQLRFLIIVLLLPTRFPARLLHSRPSEHLIPLNLGLIKSPLGQCSFLSLGSLVVVLLLLAVFIGE